MGVDTWGTGAVQGGCAFEGTALRMRGVARGGISPYSPRPADDGSGDLSSTLHVLEDASLVFKGASRGVANRKGPAISHIF